VVLEGLKKAWDVLVSPRYSAARNFYFRPITGWQSIEFAEADMTEAGTGRSVYVVLFKMNYSNGSGRYLEFITSNKDAFEREFRPYHEKTFGWEKLESMADYNKFGVTAADLRGKWTNDFSGSLSYVMPTPEQPPGRIRTLRIDGDDNIYVASSYEKIKDAVGTNFVTDSYYSIDRNSPSPKYDKTSVPRFNVVRKISGGMVSTLKTPDGKFNLPHAVSAMTTDSQGNIIYAAASFARFIGKIDLATGSFTSLAGQSYKRKWCPVYTQGDADKAEFVDPASAIISNKKGEILFTDIRINRIIKVAGGKVWTLAGNNIIDPCGQNMAGRSQEGNKDGKASTALFNSPQGMAYDSKGNLFIADMSNHVIRKLSPDGTVSTFAK